jgi:hypothetical protein
VVGLAEFETVEVVGDRIIGGVFEIWRGEVSMVWKDGEEMVGVVGVVGVVEEGLGMGELVPARL